MPRLSLAIQRLAVSGSAFAAFALAGCSESSAPARTTAPEAASLSQTPDVIDPTGRHVFHTKPWFDNPANNARPGGGGTSTNTGIYYHGGPVLQAVTQVVTIYWGTNYGGQPAPGVSGDSSKDQSLIGAFLKNVGGSNYFNINSTYTDGNQKNILNAVAYMGTWANNTNVPTGTQNVSDADMLAMLSAGFKSGKIAYDPNTLYAIFTAGAVNLGGGYTSPPQYCAYHYHGTVTLADGNTATALYAAMPYNAQYLNYCTSGLTPTANGSKDPAADYEINTLAHEIEETTTDMMGTAWFDHRGYENADKCAWTWGPTKTDPKTGGGIYNVSMGGLNFLIQRNWLNVGSGGCAQGYPAP